MNRYALGILILMVCSSCAVYRYDVLDSNMPGTPKAPFTLEDDTLRLSYSFPNGLLTLNIFNKSEDPLYVDWSRSAKIADGVSASYDVTESPVSFIPPGAGMTRPLFSIADNSPVENNPLDVQRYTRESSPVKFRSFLMLSFDQDFYEPFTMDHTFWLAERHESKEPDYTMHQKPNIISGSVPTKTGSATAGVFVVLASIPVVWIWHQLNYPEEY